MAIVSTTTAASRRSLTTVERYTEAMPDPGELAANLESTIGRCSAAIERYVGRVLARERVTERIRTEAGTVLMTLERRPVVTVHQVTVEGQPIAADGWKLDSPAAGLLRIEGTNQNALWDELVGQYGQGDYGYRPGPPRSLIYEIDYTAGWIVPDQTGGAADLPDDIEAACQLAVRGYLERQGRPMGATSIRLGDASWSFAADPASGGFLTAEIRAMLDPYRNVPL